MGAGACSKQQELLKWQEFWAYKPTDDRNTCFVWANGWLYGAEWLSLALGTFMFSTLITSNSLRTPFHSCWDETFLTRHTATKPLGRLYSADCISSCFSVVSVSEASVCHISTLLLCIQMAGRVNVFMLLGEGTLWEKLFFMFGINEGVIRVFSGPERACMEILLLCENLFVTSP